jgi:cellulose synthase (UDP-forming)
VVFERDAGDGKSVILTWTLYNLAVLAATMAVCIELPRPPAGSAGGTLAVSVRGRGVAMRGWAMRLTAEDAWIRGGPVPEPRRGGRARPARLGGIRARIARRRRRACRSPLMPDAEQRAR